MGKSARGRPAVLACLLLFAAGCRPSRVLLSPVPDRIDAVEGYASLTITGDQGTDRTKFSFVFQIPERGRIEVSDFLGRTLYQIIINDQGAYFVVPSKKVYWQGPEEEIIDKFFGFGLALDEIVFLISGQRFESEEESPLSAWTLSRDGRGRVVAGQRNELRFSVLEFIEGTGLAETLEYEHPLNRGKMRILRMAFNPAVNPRAFETPFLGRFSRKSWEEIQEIFRDEN